jgi:ribosomal protein S18 acetylase RimI-like enzyme
MSAFYIEPSTEDQSEVVGRLLVEHWGSTRMVTRGRLLDVAALPGFIAWRGSEPVGLVMYEIVGPACEITVLQSVVEGVGIGTELIEAVKAEARRSDCSRLWLITTNDNTPALRFYQRRGFHLAALHRNALKVSRLLKPEIPLIGLDDIPLRDEIELEMTL